MPQFDNLNRTSRDGFINAVLSLYGVAIQPMQILEAYRSVPPRQPVFAWIGLAFFAIAAVYMFYRGCRLQREEKRRLEDG